jgi:phospholipase/carboxylesterase
MLMNKPQLVEYGRAAYLTGLAHRVRQPEKAGPHPTVVMLHGRHGTEDVTWVFAPALPADWLLIAPRGIEEEPEKPGDTAGYSWLIQQDHIPAESGLWPSLADFRDAVEALAYFIKSLPDVYGADPEQIYLLGFSQGAAAALVLALQQPELVRGVASLVGFVPQVPDYLVDIRPLAHMPIWMGAGTADKRIPLNVSQRTAHTLRHAGADLSYHEYDTGHKLNSAGMKDLKAWWAQFSQT